MAYKIVSIISVCNNVSKTNCLKTIVNNKFIVANLYFINILDISATSQRKTRCSILGLWVFSNYDLVIYLLIAVPIVEAILPESDAGKPTKWDNGR